MDGRCPHCPAPPDVACYCVTSGARRGCAKVDPSSPAYDPRYLPILVRWSRGEFGPTCGGSATSSPALVPVAKNLGRLKLVKACDHRSTTTKCGCGGMATCAIGKGKGDGLVSLRECLACVADQPVG